MSLWQEKDEASMPVSQAALSDVVFKIECRSLPVDHAAQLTDTLCKKAPWLADTACAGIHPIHVAGSQNGWQRPDAESGVPLILSKRTRLRIRVPQAQVAALIEALTDTTHQLDGHNLVITSGRAAPLHNAATLFARFTIYESNPDSEDAFIQQVIKDCEAIAYHPTKLLCGKTNYLSTPAGHLAARSLLIADVPPEYSMLLQERGLGDYRLMGCGILIPHKYTGAV